MYPKNNQPASAQSICTSQNATSTRLKDSKNHAAYFRFTTAKIPASQLGKSGGVDEITRFLEVSNRDRTWIKWGHGRFALIERTATGYDVRPTRLAVSQGDVDAGRATESERSRSREFTGEVYDLAWLLRLSQTTEQKGIFWIPAATAAELPLKSEIQSTDVISCEIDLCPKIEQLERFEWFREGSGLDYGLQLTSGSKSIHVHIFLNEPVPFDQADRLRKLFILCLLGDPAIANRTQPMRAPGFFRQEKGSFQALLSSSDTRYSLEQVEAGLKKVYADLGWAFPATLSNELWRDCLPWLKERRGEDGEVLPVVASEQIEAIGALLERGDRWYVQQAQLRQERAEANRLKRAQLELSGQFDLLGAVQAIDAQLSPDQAFNGTDHKWAFSGSDKARGHCHWHGSISNSAWLTRGDKGWAYHCPTCTGDKPLSGFAYWLAEHNGVGAAFPTGKEWAQAATEYVTAHGVEVPEWKPAASKSAPSYSASFKVETARIPLRDAIFNQSANAQDAEAQRVARAQAQKEQAQKALRAQHIAEQWAIARNANPKLPIVLREQRGCTLKVEVLEKAVVITVPGFFVLYQTVSLPEGGKARQLIDEMSGLTTPEHKIYLHISGSEVPAKITGSRVAFGGLLAKQDCHVRVTESGDPNQSKHFRRWRSEQMALLARKQTPRMYGLTGQREIVDTPFVTFELPEPGGFLGVSAGMGKGKTTNLKNVYAQFFERHPDGLFDSIGFRNSLGDQKVAEINAHLHSIFPAEQASALEIAHIKALGVLAIDQARALEYCIDSLPKRIETLNHALNEGRPVCIILDEMDAIATHQLSGGTLKGRQADIFLMFQNLLQRVRLNGGYIIGMEALLSQDSVDFITELSGGQQATLLENVSPAPPRQILNYTATNESGEPSDRLLRMASATVALRLLKGESITGGEGLLLELANSSDEEIEAALKGIPAKPKILFTTDSQAHAEKLEYMAKKAGFKAERHDATTAEEPYSQYFRENPDEALEATQPDIVICNSSIEAGQSYNRGYFDLVIGDGSHLGARALTQMPARERGAVPLLLFINERNAFATADYAQLNADGVLKAWNENASDSRSFSEVDRYLGAENANSAFASANTGLGARFHYWKARFEARKNQSDANLREHTLLNWKTQGHTITEAEPLAYQDFTQAEWDYFKEAHEAVHDCNAQKYADSPGSHKPSWAHQILNSNSAKHRERVEARKCLDKANFPGLAITLSEEQGKIALFDNSDFVREEVIKKRYSTLAAHELMWLYNHPEIAQRLDLKSWKSQMESNFTILPALRNQTAKVKVAADSVLIEIVKGGDYSNATPLAIAFREWALEHAPMIYRLFRLQIKPGQTPVQVVNKFLKKFGYTAELVKQEGPRGKRARVYRAKPMPYQAAVFAALSRKWKDELAAETIEIEQPQSVNTTRNRDDNELCSRLDPLAKALEFIQRNCTTYDQYQSYHSSLSEDLAFQVAMSLPQALAEKFAATA